MTVGVSKPAFILDASIALAWCFEDEASPETSALLDRLGAESASVPQLWRLEIGNVLIQAERRNRLTEAKMLEFLGLLEEIHLDVDHSLDAKHHREIIRLARAHKLSTYDATYLELALRKGLPLASKDAALRQAAASLGLAVLPEGQSS